MQEGAMRAPIVIPILAALAGCATAQRGALTAAPTSPAPALTADTIVGRLPRQGEAVRVIIPATPTAPQQLVRGYFQRLTGDTAILQREMLLGRRAPPSVLDTLPLRGSSELQVLVRRRSHALAGFGMGFAAGALLGGAIGSGGTTDPAWKPHTAALGAVGLGLAGGIVGALIGNSMGAEEWATVDLGRPGVGAAVGQFGVRVTF
jgi:hypothetical protein